MRRPVLIDAGPIVTIFSDRDARHDEISRAIGMAGAPLVTCWPVLAEAAWLLRRDSWRVERLVQACEGGLLHPEPITRNDLPSIRAVIRRFTDLRLQLADACLLTLADRIGCDTIITFDRRDFGAALTPAGRALRMLPEAVA